MKRFCSVLACLCLIRGFLGAVVMKRFCSVLACLCLMTAFAWGEGRVPKERAVRTFAELVPQLRTPLPYRGYGEVTILDDATLIVQMGGEIITERSESLAFDLGAEGLAAIDCDGRLFLDRHRVAWATERLPFSAKINSFPTLREIADEPNRYAFITLTGEMELTFDSRTMELSVVIETEDTVFSHSIRIARRDANDREMLSSDTSASSECSVRCASGYCSVTCTKKGCKAFCINGEPSCLCVMRVEIR